MTVSEWADTHRELVRESSSGPGRWRTAFAPYQKAIMDAFTAKGVWKIVIMSAAQKGKTDMMLNMLGRAIDLDPGPMLFIEPTVDFAEDFARQRVAPMIRVCKPLRGKVSEAKSRDGGNTLSLKTFPGGYAKFVGANSPTDLAGRPVRYIFMDEVDKFPKSAGAEGDPMKLGEARTETFRHNRRVVITSTPTIKGRSNVEREYNRGTREEYSTQCSACGSFNFILFNDIRFDISDDDGRRKADRARWRCPVCRNEMDEYDTKRSPAKWIARNPRAIDSGVVSFHVNPFMAPWCDWLAVCNEFLDAGTDPEMLKVFHNVHLGEVWEVFTRRGEPERLYNRREAYQADVPSGVLLLTCGIDTQGNRLEYEIVGWNQFEESWGIARGVIPGRADSSSVWEQVDMLLEREWRMENGMTMRVLATFIDSGGHFTQEIYRECDKRVNRRIWPVKGEGGEGKQYVRPMSGHGDVKGAGIRFLIGVDSGKEAIMHATSVEEPGPRYMHYPDDDFSGYDLEYFRGLFAEQQVIARKGGKATVSWEQIGAHNEPLDMRNYARAAFKYFNWDFRRLEMALYGESKPAPAWPTRERPKNGARLLSKGIA